MNALEKQFAQTSPFAFLTCYISDQVKKEQKFNK